MVSLVLFVLRLQAVCAYRLYQLCPAGFVFLQERSLIFVMNQIHQTVAQAMHALLLGIHETWPIPDVKPYHPGSKTVLKFGLIIQILGKEISKTKLVKLNLFSIKQLKHMI